GAASDASPFVSIDPPLKGSFRWYGASFLSFESDEPCQSRRTYTISVSPSTRSLYGKKIEGQTRFSFETERLAMDAIEPGVEFKKETGVYFSLDDTPPAAAKQITISFNYPVQAEKIADYIAIASSLGGEKKFDLTQLAENSLLASLRDNVESGATVTVTLKQGVHSGADGSAARTPAGGGAAGESAKDQVLSFRTAPVFSLTGTQTPALWGDYNNVFTIDFSARIDAGSALGALRPEPAMPIAEENIRVWNTTILIGNLPVGFNDKFRIIVDTNLRDISGRPLDKNYDIAFTSQPEPPPAGSVNFLDGGGRMLEAQFEPRFLFEYRNIAKDSFYQLEQKNNPYSDEAQKTDTIKLNGFEKNYTYFEEMNLRPYLNSEGKGFVSFNAGVNLLERAFEPGGDTQKTRTVKNRLNLQVTDLGITVRAAFNKVVVMVTSLSTGEPVEGAAVKLIAPRLVASNPDIGAVDSFAKALTDKNGLAVINMAAGVARAALNEETAWRPSPYVFVEKDGDRAVFNPASHNIWRFGINSASLTAAERAQPVTFMFSDRGLYKPGETITFRGVDRSLLLGMYTIYNGDYRVELVEDKYTGSSSQKIVASLSGKTSESGGYYGSIKLSEDLTPGEYRLKYFRAGGNGVIAGGNNGGDRAYADIPITAAYFERLKFQASISPPAAEITAGNDINVTLQASYLSGGNLSDAKWTASWFRELAYFNPDTPETKRFVFGPSGAYDQKRVVSSSAGVLSADGEAVLTQKTGGDSVAGAAYRYSAAAIITDISNQQTRASCSMLVHPALFYIGAAPAATSGFAKAGEEVSFNYITVSPSGKPLPDGVQFLDRGGGARGITAELIREEWIRVQQRGVNGYVYDNYERSEIIDSSEKIAAKSSGAIKVKPSKAGFYILRLTSFDRDGKKALTEITFYATGSRFSSWNRGGAEELRLVPDKAVYNPGETAEILLQSSLPSGRYLITVEREGVFTEEIKVFDEAVPVIKIPIARNYVPVVYVSIASYSTRSGPPAHSYGSPDLDKPKGCYGAVKLFVNPRARAFSIKVESAKKVFRPGEEVTLTLTAEKDGRPLPNTELSLMAVDRGVLDLINYHVPDPVSFFYNEDYFPLRVTGGDSRDMLMDPVTYTVKNLYGGDAAGGDKIEERKDFNPLAVFEPFLLTDHEGKVTCSFTLPDTLTTYRISVFGARGDLFSLKETEIAARNVLNAQAVQPRRLRERDTAEAGVLITNLDSAPHKISVSLSIGEASENDGGEDGAVKQKGAAFVDGAAEHTFTVKSGGNAVVYFDVAAEKQGAVNLVYTIESGVLNERLIQNLIIEKPYITETVVAAGAVSEGAASAESSELVIPGFADDGLGSLAITLDATRLSLMEASVNYLFHYPYGCLEQRSAAILPLIIFGEYIDALNLRSEVSDPKKIAQKEIASWAKSQRPGGGFPYWPAGLTSDLYVSLRIAHITALAQEKNIPTSFNTDKLYGYLETEYQKLYRESLRSRRGGAAGGGDSAENNFTLNSYMNNAYLQSYMLYVFSLLKKNVDAAHITELVSANKDNPAVLAFAGMTARGISRNDIASNAGALLRNLLRPTARGVDLSAGGGRTPYTYYGGKTEQLALTLQFFIGQYPGDAINTRLLYSLLENERAGGYWDNTAVTVRVLSALDRLIQSENLVKTNVTSTAALGGRELLKASFKGLGAKAVSKVFQFKDFPLAALPRDSTLPLTVTRSGTGDIYWTAALSYALPAEMQVRRDEGIGVFQTIRDVESGEMITGGQLESGKLYRLELRISSSRDRTYLAARVPVPDGAEILDARLATGSPAPEDAEFTPRENGASGAREISYQAIFDNEVRYFWDTFSKGETSVRFLFRAVRRGVYPTPPVQAECMYESEIFGRSEGALFTIK
ncbi:MAG: alpha-2-macroglobulin, partial [Spirochaetaceae bacterium]|nr:alpha-2-macroglobulin [Spirochaetaceae bacterium]